MMTLLTSWFESIGDKEGRTDLWVALLVIIYIITIVPIFSMSMQLIPLNDTIYSTQTNFLYFLTGGFFIDLGIDVWKKFQIFKNEKFNPTIQGRNSSQGL